MKDNTPKISFRPAAWLARGGGAHVSFFFALFSSSTSSLAEARPEGRKGRSPQRREKTCKKKKKRAKKKGKKKIIKNPLNISFPLFCPRSPAKGTARRERTEGRTEKKRKYCGGGFYFLLLGFFTGSIFYMVIGVCFFATNRCPCTLPPVGRRGKEHIIFVLTIGSLCNIFNS
tara:strand:- start:53 stop:571 length:519 start_codon:yes stop_codon:yes gene_type:complete